jgi:N utilization substance protein B
MPQANPTELFDLFQEHLALEKGQAGYSKELVHCVFKHQAEIDALIQKYSINWNIKRLSLIDLNILRVAVCEMLFMKQDPTPPKSATDEAIEIAKKFSSNESPAFINGILDQIIHKELKYE